MGFDAAKDIDPFDYNLSPYVDAKGTTPEPSDEAVRKFYVGLGNMLEDTLGEERLRSILTTEEYADFKLRKPEPLIKVQAATNNEEDMAAASDRALQLHADICGGSPTVDELAQLPFRVKQAFYGALQRWLSPEASRPAGRN